VLHAEKLADPTLRGLNRAIDLGCWQPREVRKQLSDQGLERQALPQRGGESVFGDRTTIGRRRLLDLLSGERGALLSPGSGFVLTKA
jgi:hypothetical protein